MFSPGTHGLIAIMTAGRGRNPSQRQRRENADRFRVISSPGRGLHAPGTTRPSRIGRLAPGISRAPGCGSGLARSTHRIGSGPLGRAPPQAPAAPGLCQRPQPRPGPGRSVRFGEGVRFFPQAGRPSPAALIPASSPVLSRASRRRGARRRGVRRRAGRGHHEAAVAVRAEANDRALAAVRSPRDGHLRSASGRGRAALGQCWRCPLCENVPRWGAEWDIFARGGGPAWRVWHPRFPRSDAPR